MREVEVSLPLLVGAAFAFGACIGSFLNVVIWRLPRGESLLFPGSRCPACKQPIPAFANVPILSYLALRGRCRSCRAPISPRYPFVEALTGALFAALLFAHGPSARLLVEWAIAAALIAVIFIDLDHYIIPNEITYGLFALGLATSLIAPGLTLPFVYAVSSALLWGALLWAFSTIVEWWYGQPAFGMGDVKLIAAFASFFGLVAPAQMLVLGAIIGLAYGLAETAPRIARLGLRSGSRASAILRFPLDAYLEVRKQQIAFGPGLAMAGIALLLQPGFAHESVRSSEAVVGWLLAHFART